MRIYIDGGRAWTGQPKPCAPNGYSTRMRVRRTVAYSQACAFDARYETVIHAHEHTLQKLRRRKEQSHGRHADPDGRQKHVGQRGRRASVSAGRPALSRGAHKILPGVAKLELGPRTLHLLVLGPQLRMQCSPLLRPHMRCRRLAELRGRSSALRQGMRRNEGKCLPRGDKRQCKARRHCYACHPRHVEALGARCSFSTR